MKAKLTLSYILACLFISLSSFGQGRVVINEYMPWTANGCGVTSEFVELLNYGPGPADIGCYILTDGDYSVTIPSPTILMPGQYYVISGKDQINFPCANIDSTIHASLNWNTCNCTNQPIPTTGDGFFTDGGTANEQIVLMDNRLNVIDAVVRDFPVEPSRMITTHEMDECSSQSFDLDLMNIHYETLGMSLGRGNSFARKLDGDCGWIKDPQQSANATNNTPGTVSDVTYNFSYVNSMDCSTTHGSVSIYVKKDKYEDFFPMTYTLAYDADQNGVFDFNDHYEKNYDDSPPEVTVDNLMVGRYRLTLESVFGCDLKTFDFEILPCYPLLPVKLVYFRYEGQKNNNHKLSWALDGVENMTSVTLEKALPNKSFVQAATFTLPAGAQGQKYFTTNQPVEGARQQFRLKIRNRNGQEFYSPVVSAESQIDYEGVKISPNPATSELHVQLSSPAAQTLPYAIYNVNGMLTGRGNINLKMGTNSFQLSIASLPAGIYQFQSQGSQPISFRFVKQ